MKNRFFDIQELGTKEPLLQEPMTRSLLCPFHTGWLPERTWTHARNCNAFLYTYMLFVHWLRNNKRRRRRLYLGMMTR
jgi:hypothetical protein